MTTYNFFVMCPEEGFQVFETLDEALDAANERIKGYLTDCWSEDVTGVCAGKITHRAKMCDQVFPEGEINDDGVDEAGDYWDPDCDYKCNYKMIVNPQPEPEVAKLLEALEVVKTVLESEDPAIADTIWVPDHVSRSETLYDYICSTIATCSQQGGDV